MLRRTCVDSFWQVAPMSPPALLLHLNTIDKVTGLPRDYMLVARSTLLLRGLGAKMQAPVSCAAVWESEARAFLRTPEAAAAIAAEEQQQKQKK